MHRFLPACAVVVTASCLVQAAPADLDAALGRFWGTANPSAAARTVDDIVRTGAAFDEVYVRLKQGRTYRRNVATGIVQGRRVGLAGEFGYTLDVPETYDPARPYQVRIQLHGGVMRPQPSERRSAGIGRLAGAEQIYVLPYAWSDAPWWSDLQVENLRSIVDTIKRTYNVDENRVAVAGVSDGATGAFYVAMRDPTPYSSFLPLNGSIVVLSNPRIGISGDLFPSNLINRPFFIVNGGRDPLYSTMSVEPYLQHLARGGVPITYVPQPQAGHDTSWWPEVKDAFEAFVRDHPRNPLPDRLTWETSEPRKTGRAHWLVIDSLGATPADATDLPDLNVLTATSQLFAHSPRTGRVDLVREGNTVRLATRGVRQLTLLISPDQFDVGQPLVVAANGRTVFEGRIEKSVATLMKWASRDNDRTMLFSTELKIAIR